MRTSLCQNRLFLLTVVIIATSNIVHGFRLSTSTSRVLPSPSNVLPNKSRKNIPSTVSVRSADRHQRTFFLGAGVEDYGPQFASYLQNDVSVYTVGKEQYSQCKEHYLRSKELSLYSEELCLSRIQTD